MNGTLRHSAKHRQQALWIRDRFPRMVTRTFKVSYLAMRETGIRELVELIHVPKGSTINRLASPKLHAELFVVRHPAHLPVVINPRFVQEIRE